MFYLYELHFIRLFNFVLNSIQSLNFLVKLLIFIKPIQLINFFFIFILNAPSLVTFIKALILNIICILILINNNLLDFVRCPKLHLHFCVFLNLMNFQKNSMMYSIVFYFLFVFIILSIIFVLYLFAYFMAGCYSFINSLIISTIVILINIVIMLNLFIISISHFLINIFTVANITIIMLHIHSFHNFNYLFP